MNGKERVNAVIKGTWHDKVPVMCQLSMGHIVKNSGVSPAEFYLNYYDLYPKTLAALVARYEFDGALLDYPPGISPAHLKEDLKHIVDNSDGQTIYWKNGDETFCPVNDYPIEKPKHTKTKKPLSGSRLDDLGLIEGYMKPYDLLAPYYMKPFHDVLSLLGSTHSIHSFVITPLTMFIHTIGAQEALIGLLDDPPLCKKLLDEITDACITWADNTINAGVHAVCVSSPFEGSGFISLDMFKEFGLPYTKRLVEHIRGRGLPSYMHMCGSISDRLEAIADTGVDGIECLDPPPIGDVELKDAVTRIGDKVFIKGNIDPVNTLLLKNESECYSDAVMRIKTAGHTKRFILSTACSVSPNTPPENLKVLIKAVNEHGIY